MQTDAPQRFRELITTRFDKNELQNLFFDLGLDFEEARSESKSELVRYLIKTCWQQQRLAQLVAMCRQRRPIIDWPGLSDDDMEGAIARTMESEVESSVDITIGSINFYTTPPLTDSAPWYMPFEDLANFTGHHAEFDTAITLLTSEKRHCFLYGMAGVGKSALANRAARRLRPHFAAGGVWIHVGGPEIDDEITTDRQQWLMNSLIEMGSSFNIDFKEVDHLEGRSNLVRAELAKKQALIILDDVRSVADLRYLLPDDPKALCTVIVTTRNKRVTEGFESETIHLQPFDNETSITLLRSVIEESRPREYAQADLDTLRDISRFVGGLPLALRVIGSTIRNYPELTLQEYCYDYLGVDSSRLDRLDDGTRSNNVKQALDSSYRLLSPDLKFCFAALSVFAGDDFSADAVANVTIPSPASRDQLVSRKMQLGMLCDLSLINRESVPAAGSNAGSLQRYRFHTLLRLLARDKLNSDFPEHREQLARQCVDYYIDMCTQFRTDGHSTLAQDWSNIRAAMEWCIEREYWAQFLQGYEALTRPYLGILGYLDASGRWDEGKGWGDSALEQAVDGDDMTNPDLLFRRAVFAFRQGNLIEAREELSQAFYEFDHVQDKSSKHLIRQTQICHSLAELEMRDKGPETGLGWLDKGLYALNHVPGESARHEEGYTYVRRAATLGILGRLDEVLPELERGLPLLPDHPTAARISALTNVGVLNAMQGKREAALEAWAQAAQDAEALGDIRRQADLARNRANLAAEYGEFGIAIPAQRQALGLYDQIGDVFSKGMAASNLGLSLLEYGDEPTAIEQIRLALQIANEHDFRPVQVTATINLIRWQLLQGDWDAAERSLETILQYSGDDNEPEILRLSAEIASHCNEMSDALRLVDRSIAAAEDNEMIAEQGRSYRLKTQILLESGDVEAAREAHIRAIECFDGNSFEIDRTKEAFARLAVDK